MLYALALHRPWLLILPHMNRKSNVWGIKLWLWIRWLIWSGTWRNETAYARVRTSHDTTSEENMMKARARIGADKEVLVLEVRPAEHSKLCSRRHRYITENTVATASLDPGSRIFVKGKYCWIYWQTIVVRKPVPRNWHSQIDCYGKQVVRFLSCKAKKLSYFSRRANIFLATRCEICILQFG